MESDSAARTALGKRRRESESNDGRKCKCMVERKDVGQKKKEEQGAEQSAIQIRDAAKTRSDDDDKDSKWPAVAILMVDIRAV